MCYGKKKAAESTGPSVNSGKSTTSSKKPLKILLVGDGGVGKTSLLLRLVDQMFPKNPIISIGQDYKTHELTLEDNQTCHLQIWDTAGQERFNTLTSSYYRDAKGVLVCYDGSDQQTFEALPNLLKELERYCQDVAVNILVGTKSDTEWEVNSAEADEFAERNNMQHFKTSAKDDINVTEVFVNLAKDIIQNTENSDFD